jgi:hypothetical protein
VICEPMRILSNQCACPPLPLQPEGGRHMEDGSLAVSSTAPPFTSTGRFTSPPDASSPAPCRGGYKPVNRESSLEVTHPHPHT